MRISRKAFLACAVVGGLSVLAAPAAMATGGSCAFTLSFATEGPCPVNSTTSPVCVAEGAFTGIKYKNTGSSLDHVATLVTRNNALDGSQIIPVSPTQSQVFGDCAGDTLSGLGKHSCHERAVKLNGLPAGQSFWILVSGQKAAIETSVVGKKCGTFKSMAIVGLGLDSPSAPVTETLQHEGCAVEFTLNAITGAVISAKLTHDSLLNECQSPGMDPEDGTLNGSPAENLELLLNGVSLGAGNFGSGYINSGPGSCTTRVVGGKVYTFGKPCP